VLSVMVPSLIFQYVWLPDVFFILFYNILIYVWVTLWTCKY